MYSTTLPRGFRFHHEEGPKTPEPLSTDEIQPPSPPRQRFKVRRRNASSLQAPTEQFLASVAAADVAIPTIEIPKFQDDSEMVDRQKIEDIRLLAPKSYPYRFPGSPPKTPMLLQSMEEAMSRRPDWAMGPPSPEPEEFFRPTSSQSHTSDTSDDSFYGSSHASRPSEDGSCTSPESEADIFEFRFPKGKGKTRLYADDEAPLNGQIRSKTRKDAAWTPAQCNHLWKVYNVYLQDATVTPFRFGNGTVPPEGVCYRVAREAKKSWKGPKTEPQALVREDTSSRASEKSGSATPTGEAPKAYAAWPHSSGATRARLRAMCKSDTTGASRHRHLQIRTPTPFSRLNPPRTPTSQMIIDPFGTKDIAMSLITSTSESMQPEGPLAKLAAPKTSFTPYTPKRNSEPKTPALSSFDPEPFKPAGIPKSRSLGSGIDQGALGSPFVPFNRTYGPSSSKSLHPYDRPTSRQTQSDNQPALLSPVRFESRSLNNTSKRRAQHAFEDELSPNGAIVRPSILDEQLFGTPFSQRRVRSRGFSLNDAGARHRTSGVFQHPVVDPQMEEPVPQPPQLLPSVFGPPRLGSPFLESKTFPRRGPSDGSTIRRSAFATMHQSRRSIESFDFTRGPSRPTRVEQLDKVLRQIHEREAAANRHQPSE